MINNIDRTTSNAFNSVGDRGIIPTDRDGKPLRVTSNCDFSRVMLEFTYCMQRNGHGAIMNENADEKPVRPDQEFARRTNNNVYNPHEQGDQRKIADYLKMQRYWS